MFDGTAIRRRAVAFHYQLRSRLPANTPLLVPADTLLAAAAEETGISALPLKRGHPLLAGAHAVLDRETDRIYYADGPDEPPTRRRFVLAHEYAHIRLHPTQTYDLCAAEDEDEIPLPITLHSAVGYSPAERREAEANQFAAELLLPAPVLQEAFVKRGWNALEIARRTGLSEACVLSQLANALLLPDILPSQADATPDTLVSISDHFEPLEDIELDASQRAAATVAQGPILVDAGPGTGKTRTLIGRIRHLLTQQGVPPERILALTFSNRAAEEMRSRLRAYLPEEADRVWISTFHTFGLEVLKKYGGYPAPPRLLEPAEAIARLEASLDRLELGELEYLHQPTYAFPDILNCIARAKDELKTPVEYREAAAQQREEAAARLVAARTAWETAQAERASARDRKAQSAAKKRGKAAERHLQEAERARAAAEKSLTVAEVYAVYQEMLESEGFVDFGDLLMKPVQLLRRDEDVRNQLRAQYPHILADEYQDINRASAELLRLLAGEGAGFWAVGDLRQAIYGFIGASARSLRDFERDFPNGRRLSLQCNYRSRHRLVALFNRAAQALARDLTPPAPLRSTPAAREERREAVLLPSPLQGEGPGMRVEARTSPPSLARDERSGKGAGGTGQGEQVPSLWQARHEDDGEAVVTLAVAEDEAAQADGLAAQIRSWQAAGIPLRAQAVLCRTNAQATTLAAELERRGLATQLIGSLFHRAEVRDLLALLSLAAEPEGTGLWRVATFAEYAIPQEDVRRLLTGAQQREIVFPEALRLADTLEGLSEVGRRGLKRLRAQLEPLRYRGNAWRFLARYLFAGSDYLRPLLLESTVVPRQKRLAIYHVLAFVRGLIGRLPEELEDEGLRAFLDYLRRLFVWGEDHSVRAGGYGELDGVLVMTLHAAKGLEFPVVYLPNLTQRQFTPRGRSGLVNPPEALASEDAEAAEAHGEAALFFVGLTRARHHLVLSYPAQNRGRAEQPARYLTALEGALSADNTIYETWRRREAAPIRDVMTAPLRHAGSERSQQEVLRVGDLELYRRCPRRYFYERVVALRAERSAYAMFHTSLMQTLRWAQASRAAGEEPDIVEAVAQFYARWPAGTEEPADATTRQLRRRVYPFLENALRNLAKTEKEPAGLDALIAELPSGQVVVRCDKVEAIDGTLCLTRYELKRPGADDHTEPQLALLREAGRRSAGRHRVRIALEYLTDGRIVEVQEAPRYEPERIAKYDQALQGVRAGDFSPRPSDRECPHCPFFFICPA